MDHRFTDYKSARKCQPWIFNNFVQFSTGDIVLVLYKAKTVKVKKNNLYSHVDFILLIYLSNRIKNIYSCIALIWTLSQRSISLQQLVYFILIFVKYSFN